jgi:hypothetical protein
MAIRNSWKNLAGTTLAPAGPAVDFKNCCLRDGAFDGERRNYFFQGLSKGADQFRPESIRRFEQRQNFLFRHRAIHYAVVL